MKNVNKFGIFILGLFVFFLITGATLSKILSDKYPYPELSVFHKAFSLIYFMFVDPIDNEILLKGAERGLLMSLDPINLLIPKEKVHLFKKWKKEPLYDCGIKLRRSGRFIYIYEIYPQSAAEGQFEIGDIIEEVNGLKYPIYDFWELDLELRGDVGKSVKIHYTPISKDKPKDIVLKIKPYRKENLKIIYEEDFLRLKFYEINMESLKKLKNEIPKIPKNLPLVLDLRATSSFDYDSAFKIADLFIEGRFNILYKDLKSSTKKKIEDENYYPFSEIYIMQDFETFGSAEILSMLLQKKGKAKVFGTNTFGYVGIPKEYNLSDKSILYLTSLFVLFEDETNLMKKGLKPDVEVKESFFYSETYNKIEDTLREFLKEKKKKVA